MNQPTLAAMSQKLEQVSDIWIFDEDELAVVSASPPWPGFC
jgi:hypothetical protein